MVKHFTFSFKLSPRYSIKPRSSVPLTLSPFSLSSSPSHKPEPPSYSQFCQHHSSPAALIASSTSAIVAWLASTPPPTEFGSTTQTHWLLFRSDHTPTLTPLILLTPPHRLYLHLHQFTHRFLDLVYWKYFTKICLVDLVD